MFRTRRFETFSTWPFHTLKMSTSGGHLIYHRYPDEQIIECYTDLDLMLDESIGAFEPRPWHRDNPQKPKV